MAHKKHPKKPKAPKASASLSVWERYEQRVNEWKKKCTQIDADERKRKSLINKFKK